MGWRSRRPDRRFVMRGPEIVNVIGRMRTNDHLFVKWWRKENDFIDYDLLDHFLENLTDTEEIGGIDLLTMDEMWHEVERVSDNHVRLVHGDNGDVIGWLHEGKSGMRSHTCDLTAENLMKIFDIETKGNPIH